MVPSLTRGVTSARSVISRSIAAYASAAADRIGQLRLPRCRDPRIEVRVTVVRQSHAAGARDEIEEVGGRRAARPPQTETCTRRSTTATFASTSLSTVSSETSYPSSSRTATTYGATSALKRGRHRPDHDLSAARPGLVDQALSRLEITGAPLAAGVRFRGPRAVGFVAAVDGRQQLAGRRCGEGPTAHLGQDAPIECQVHRLPRLERVEGWPGGVHEHGRGDGRAEVELCRVLRPQRRYLRGFHEGTHPVGLTAHDHVRGLPRGFQRRGR